MYNYFVQCHYGVVIMTLIGQIRQIALYTPAKEEFRKTLNDGRNCEGFENVLEWW